MESMAGLQQRTSDDASADGPAVDVAPPAKRTAAVTLPLFCELEPARACKRARISTVDQKGKYQEAMGKAPWSPVDAGFLSLAPPGGNDHQSNANNALVVYGGVVAIEAVPMRAVHGAGQPRAVAEHHQEAPGATEPAWIRDELFASLHLPFGAPLHFIERKRVTASDLSPQQNRFLLPHRAVQDRLHPRLTEEELKEASFDLVDQQRPKPVEQPTGGADGKKRKKQGKVHGGLAVHVARRDTGVEKLKLTQWEGSRGTVLKGEGYIDFMGRGGFNKDDSVEIWAFRGPRAPPARVFGEWVAEMTVFYLVMSKVVDGEQRRPPPNAAAQEQQRALMEGSTRV